MKRKRGIACYLRASVTVSATGTRQVHRKSVSLPFMHSPRTSLMHIQLGAEDRDICTSSSDVSEATFLSTGNYGYPSTISTNLVHFVPPEMYSSSHMVFPLLMIIPLNTSCSCFQTRVFLISLLTWSLSLVPYSLQGFFLKTRALNMFLLLFKSHALNHQMLSRCHHIQIRKL